MVDKILSLKFFAGDEPKDRRNVVEEGLEILCVSKTSFFPVFAGENPPRDGIGYNPENR